MLTAEGVRPSLRAAAEKPPSSTARTKACSGITSSKSRGFGFFRWGTGVVPRDHVPNPGPPAQEKGIGDAHRVPFWRSTHADTFP
ncbi:hypothetical protein KH5H1_21340 [Corallococcus caeni]|nr:hypothetical protein KH5H1_21340 [Corallococcus sp. KH5-1]